MAQERTIWGWTMNQRILKIPYPEDLPEAVGETPEEFEQKLRFLMVCQTLWLLASSCPDWQSVSREGIIGTLLKFQECRGGF